MFAALAQIIFRDWQIHRLRLALTVLGIALGVAVFFAIQTTNQGLVDSLNGTIEKLAGRSTLQITAGEAGFSMDAIKAVRRTPGVALAEPVTETLAKTDLGGGTRIMVMGLDTASDLRLYSDSVDQSDVMIRDPVAFQKNPDSVAVTRTFAERYGLKDGDKINVMSSAGATQLTIRGQFDSSGFGSVYGGNVAIMDLYAAQDAFGRGRKVDRIDLFNSPDTPVQFLQNDLKTQLGPGYAVDRPDLRGQSLENSVTTVHAGFAIMSVLALTIAMFLIYNSFSISVTQRLGEIAILRSVGVERRNIQLMFLVESAVLGIVGSVIGVSTGYAMAKAAMSTLITVTATIYGFVASPTKLAFDTTFAAEALVLGIVSSLIAVWIPARSASHVDPAEALRNIPKQDIRRSVLPYAVAGFILCLAGMGLTIFTPASIGNLLQTSYSLAIQLGMLFLLPLIIRIAAHALRPLLNRIFGVEGMIAVDNMARSPKRTVATVGAIVIGLTFALSTASLVMSQKAALNRSIDKAIAADILVTSSEQLHSRTYHFSEATAEKIAGIPEAARSDTIRVTATTYDGVEVAILAHEMAAYLDISPNALDIGDVRTARELTAAGKGILISNNMGLRWNLHLGDVVTLNSPKGELRLPVVGMLDYYRSENGTIFIDRSLYKQYWDDSDVDYVFLDLKPGSNNQAVREEIESVVGAGQQAFIYTHDEYKAFVTRLIDQFFLMMYIQMVVAVLVAAIGLSNTMLISVSERRRELGIFRAIGGVRKQVVKMVLLEAACIAICGFAAGAITGVMNSYFIVNNAAKAVTGFNLQLHLPYSLIVAAIPTVIILALVSAWVPARRASRLQITGAIGYE
ncbi:MAG: ABC transporter permease [Acidobacteria bacterium]|nr:ABC transporter permease [Acidobacteriota bacterium]